MNPDELDDAECEKLLQDILRMETRAMRLRLFGHCLLFLIGLITGILIGLTIHRYYP